MEAASQPREVSSGGYWAAGEARHSPSACHAGHPGHLRLSLASHAFCLTIPGGLACLRTGCGTWHVGRKDEQYGS